MHEESDESGKLDMSKCKWFNTTGIPRTPTSKKFRQAYEVEGVVRFNMRAFGFVREPYDLVGINVFVSGIEKYAQTNRIIVSDPAHRFSKIEAYLVGVRSTEHGRIDFGNPWKKGEGQIVSSSEFRGEQDTLLLMEPDCVLLSDRGALSIQWIPISGTPHSRLGLTIL